MSSSLRTAISSTPVRIVSLVPSATEMLFALGLGREVIAVTHECDWPPEVEELPRVTRDVLEPGLSSAEIDAVPDLATVTAGVETQAATAAEALGANSQAMAAVFAALEAAGIARRDLQTSQLSLSPVYEPYRDGAEERHGPDQVPHRGRRLAQGKRANRGGAEQNRGLADRVRHQQPRDAGRLEAGVESGHEVHHYAPLRRA